MILSFHFKIPTAPIVLSTLMAEYIYYLYLVSVKTINGLYQMDDMIFIIYSIFILKIAWTMGLR